MECYNCQHSALDSNRYCNHCGQKLKINLDPTLKDIVHDGMHEFLHIDGKIFKTIKYLLWRPGFLTAEFLKGRRAEFIHPIRLYLTLSVMFFVLQSWAPGSVVVVDDNYNKNSSVSVQIPKDKDEIEKINEKIIVRIHPSIDKSLESYLRKVLLGFKNLDKHQKEFGPAYRASLAKSLFVLMPLFAFILQWTYLRRRHRYPQYLYFALEYHSALFAGLILIFPLTSLDNVIWLWLLWAVTYFVLALKRIWSDPKAIRRVLFTMFVYGWLFLLANLMILASTFYKFGLEDVG